MKSKLLLLAVLPAFLFFFSCDEQKDNGKTDENNTEETKEETKEEPKAEVFTAKEYGFSVNFYETPVQDSQDVPTLVGNLEMITFMHDATDHVYFVAISDMPAEMVEEADKDEMLDGGVDGMLEQFTNVNIIKREAIEIDGFPGRVVEAEGTTSGMDVYNKAHIFLVENRLYQVYVLAEKAVADKDKIDTFIESFKLLVE